MIHRLKGWRRKAWEGGRRRRLLIRRRVLWVLVLASAQAAARQQFESPLEDPSYHTEQNAGALRGRVSDETGAGMAAVAVEFKSYGSGPPRTTQTDSSGRFRLAGLPGGVGELRIAAPGFVPYEDSVEISADRTSFLELSLEVDSAPLVAAWLAQGNAELTAGRPAAAREQFERALTVLPDTESGAVVRSLARTYFMEGKIDEAAQALEGGLVNAPSDRLSRGLLIALLESVGRRAEAESWLAALDHDGARAASSQLPVRSLLDLAQRPTGRFRAAPTEPGPYSDAAALNARLGRDLSAEPWSPVGESFEVYVPALDRRPPAGYGAVVWISPNPLGHIPDRDIVPELDRRGLIWIGANESGNQRPSSDRIRLALTAAGALMRAYPMDRRRVWVAGYSGGGRIASALAFHFPELFAGGIFYMGCDFYEARPDVRHSGASWPAGFRPPAA